jgi:mannose-6-phosphate isomerase-like protein (cupin superfamily)
MSDDDAGATRYTIHDDPLFGMLEVMDVQKVIDDTDEPWVNWTLCRVNDSLIRLGVLHGEFHWHKHDDEDEFFLLLDGDFRIELEDRTVELKPRQAFTVPRGVMHRPVVPVRSAVVMIETAGVVATGD